MGWRLFLHHNYTSFLSITWPRITSVLAHRAMIDGGLHKKARQDKALVDEISATIILQSYMEGKRGVRS